MQCFIIYHQQLGIEIRSYGTLPPGARPARTLFRTLQGASSLEKPPGAWQTPSLPAPTPIALGRGPGCCGAALRLGCALRAALGRAERHRCGQRPCAARGAACVGGVQLGTDAWGVACGRGRRWRPGDGTPLPTSASSGCCPPSQGAEQGYGGSGPPQGPRCPPALGAPRAQAPALGPPEPRGPAPRAPGAPGPPPAPQGPPRDAPALHAGRNHRRRRAPSDDARSGPREASPAPRLVLTWRRHPLKSREILRL